MTRFLIAALFAFCAACGRAQPDADRTHAGATSPHRPAAERPVASPEAADASPAKTSSPPTDNSNSEVVAKFNTPAEETGDYGAIAVATKGAVVYAGLAYAARNRNIAERLATQICADALAEAGAAADQACATQVWFYNKCGALSTSKSGGYGTGYDDSPGGACGWAQKVCARYGPGCTPAVYVCSPGGRRGACDGGLTLQ